MDTAARSVGVIVNPNSGGNRRNKKPITDFLRRLPENAAVFEVRNADETCAAMRCCQRQNFQVLVVQGGDGTVMMVLSALFKSSSRAAYLPRLLLVPAGTTNMTHADVGSCLPLVPAVNEALRYASGHSDVLQSKERYAIRAEFQQSNRVVCGMFLGAGMIYSGILYCRQNIHSRGLRGSVGPGLALVRFVRKWLGSRLGEGSRIALQCDKGKSMQLNSAVMLATTLDRLLLRLRPFWSRRANNLAITLIEKHASTRLSSILKLLRGRHPGRDVSHFHCLSCARAEISIEGGFTIDGELFGKGQSTLQLSLQAVGPITFLN